MFTVKITPQAAEDLLEIKNYIENELKNPIAAHNTIKTIVETYENLSTIAETGIPVKRYVPFVNSDTSEPLARKNRASLTVILSHLF